MRIDRKRNGGGGEAVAEPLLDVRDLKTHFHTPDGVVRAVDGVSFNIRRGETLGIVGESGSGKSVTSLSIMRLVPQPAGRIVGGEIRFGGVDLLRQSEAQMRMVRSGEIAMVFQDPMTSLNPVLPIGRQITETIELHLKLSARQARNRAVELLGMVGIPAPQSRLDDLPHQFSGGMRQRVMIAMALSCSPRLLIADEPTTALDVTIQAQILELIARLRDELGMAVLLITHDLGVVAGIADRVHVMYAGRIVEAGSTERIFGAPRMPYTRALLRSIPRLDSARGGRIAAISGLPPDLIERPNACSFAPRCEFAQEKCRSAAPELRSLAVDHRSACHFDDFPEAEVAREPRASHASPSSVSLEGEKPIVQTRDLKLHFPIWAGAVIRRNVGAVRAVDGITLSIRRGETLGLVGESGCGKSSAGRAILQLLRPTGGSVTFEGEELTKLEAGALRRRRRDVQMIFQDPYASLNPRMSVEEILAEPIRYHGLREGRKAVAERVEELLGLVGLDPRFGSRYPHEFSGGQRQRIGIARALAVEPSFIVCDEPVSALDVSIQAQVINLLEDLQDRLGLTYLFIAHGLSVVKHISDRVAVMYLGKVVEIADSQDLYDNPLHPYTRALLSAAPIPDPQVERKRQRIILSGDVPSPADPPSGCRFHTRCPIAIDRCRLEEPTLARFSVGHQAACWRAEESAKLMQLAALDRERSTTGAARA